MRFGVQRDCGNVFHSPNSTTFGGRFIGLGRVLMYQSVPEIGVSLQPRGESCSSMRDVLRHATEDIHDRLHGHLFFRELLGQTITRDKYCALLRRLYGFHMSLEAALSAHGNLHPGVTMEKRRRVHLLVSDLKELGLRDGDISALPLSEAPLNLNEFGRFLGCLYVREGATLGGRVLSGKLGHLVGPGLECRRFFAGSDRDPELWRACCATLEQPMQVAERSAIIAAARETFEIFERWISA